MFFRFSVAALAALYLSAPALTQQAIAQQPTVHDKSQDARIDELAKQLAALTTRLGTTENKVADIDRRIESLTTNVEKLTQVTADVDSRLKSLSDKVNELSDKPSTELTAMKTQLDAISVKDGDTYVPNISAAMTGSNKFRQDMETAVNKSLKTGGMGAGGRGSEDPVLNGAVVTAPGAVAPDSPRGDAAAPGSPGGERSSACPTRITLMFSILFQAAMSR